MQETLKRSAQRKPLLLCKRRSAGDCVFEEFFIGFENRPREHIHRVWILYPANPAIFVVRIRVGALGDRRRLLAWKLPFSQFAQRPTNFTQNVLYRTAG